jgi:hypothetical protein
MASHRNRLRVRVRSFVDSHVLRCVSEREARIMCAENSDGSQMIGSDRKPLEPVADRLSRLKAPLMDIRLRAPERGEKPSPCTITLLDVVNNAFGQAYSQLGPTDSIRALQRSEDKISAWPEIHDERNVVISAGTAHGVKEYCPWPPNQLLNFA